MDKEESEVNTADIERAEEDMKEVLPPKPTEVSLLKRFLAFLFGIDLDPTMNELKAIQKQLNKAGYKYYNLKKDLILPPYPQYIFEIYEAIFALRNFFMQDTDDDAFISLIFNHYMNEELFEYESQLTKDFLSEKFKNDDMSAVRDFVNETVRVYTDTYTQDIHDKINLMYNSISVLKDFCTIDYFAFLQKFCTDMKEDDFDRNIQFIPIEKKSVEAKLEDFFLAAADMFEIETWDEQLEFLSTLPNFKPIAREKFDLMIGKLKQSNEDHSFANFAKLVSHKPTYVPRGTHRFKDIAQIHINEVKSKAEQAFNDMCEDRKEIRVHQQLEKIFGSSDIMHLPNYNVVNSNKFDAVTFDDENAISYKYAMNTAYYHTFCESYLCKEFSEILDILSMRAWSEDSKFLLGISAKYHKIMDFDKQIIQLDVQLSPSMPRGTKIQATLMNARATTSATSKLNELVTSVNTEMKALLDKGMILICEVYKAMKTLLDDCKSPSHSLINNWSDVDTYLPEPSAKVLTSCEFKLRSFINLQGYADSLNNLKD